jgi:hypothetical protein
MLTLNQIVRRIKTIALQHKQLRNFYFGNVTDFIEDKQTRYASLFLQDNQGVIDVAGKVVSYNFKMFLLDLENVSNETQKNTLDVQSDMASVATDLLAEFNHSDYLDWKLSSGSSFGLVRESFDDIVAGIVVDLTIQIPYDNNTCAVPNINENV